MAILKRPLMRKVVVLASPAWTWTVRLTKGQKLDGQPLLLNMKLGGSPSLSAR